MKNPMTTPEKSYKEDKKTSLEEHGLRGGMEKFPGWWFVPKGGGMVGNVDNDKTKTYKWI